MRDATYRSSKYAAKLVGDVIKNRIDAQRDSMVAQATTQFGLIEAKEIAVKDILTGAGIPTVLVPFYLSFGRELYGITKKHSGSIATNEAQLAKDKWAAVSRGLSGAILIEIASGVFGITVT